MIILDLKLDNFLAFNSFDINFSYPKKIVNSTIPNEHLDGFNNFRYKKIVVLMGANASGKTSIGKMLMTILNFITNKEHAGIVRFIEDKSKNASFSLDFVENKNLYRVQCDFIANNDAFDSKSISLKYGCEPIKTNDSYEKCLERLIKTKFVKVENYIETLETVPPLTWNFDFFLPSDAGEGHLIRPVDDALFYKTLENVLKVLDPRILEVKKSTESMNTYIIKYKYRDVLIKDGRILDDDKVLSSGTYSGVDIADMFATMRTHSCSFYYSDEKFSHIHTEFEKAFLSLYIDALDTDEQLIFTSHNLDLLDMDLPKHTFMFLRRDELNDNGITCVSASDYLKKSSDSVRNAVENDLFSITPDTGKLYAFLEGDS